PPYSYTLSLHDALPIYLHAVVLEHRRQREDVADVVVDDQHAPAGERLGRAVDLVEHLAVRFLHARGVDVQREDDLVEEPLDRVQDRKSTRLNSSHVSIS